MISRRAMLGGAIIAAWLAGVAVLVQRQYFRPQLEWLAEAGSRVNPGVVYYSVIQRGEQIGFASSTIDTAESSISVVDYLVADIPAGGKARRTSARTNITLSRALRVKRFDVSLDADGPPFRAGGHIDGDSVLVFGIGTGSERVDSQRVSLPGPILLPTLVPLAVALGERPKVGKRYILPVLDPSSMTSKNVTLRVLADSLFVLNDSAVYDSSTARWHGVTPDTVRAWKLSSDATGGGAGGFAGWIDEQGRVVQTTQHGFVLQRMPYEVAFQNWRTDSGRVAVTDDRDILETTLIAAGRRMDRPVHALRLRLSGARLTGFDLDGQRQRLSGDTLTIAAEPDSALSTRALLPFLHGDPSYSRPEPLIQSDDPRIIALAQRIARGSRDPRVVAERLNTWVHDSVKARVTFGIPSALQVLRSRSGDANEHTQLYVALARAAGIPARVATGLAYVDRKFYYHAWPEVLLNDWVAVDPTFGQFPADAAHVRFTVGGLARQADVFRLIANLKIDVLSVNDAPVSPPSSIRK